MGDVSDAAALGRPLGRLAPIALGAGTVKRGFQMAYKALDRCGDGHRCTTRRTP